MIHKYFLPVCRLPFHSADRCPLMHKQLIFYPVTAEFVCSSSSPVDPLGFSIFRIMSVNKDFTSSF